MVVYSLLRSNILSKRLLGATSTELLCVDSNSVVGTASHSLCMFEKDLKERCGLASCLSESGICFVPFDEDEVKSMP